MDRDLAWFLDRAPDVQDVDPQSLGPGDWSRLSIAAHIARPRPAPIPAEPGASPCQET